MSKFESPYHTPGVSDLPAHTSGVNKGEEWVLKKGREPGRGDDRGDRTARDSTGINTPGSEPIVRGMPHIPPA